MQNLTLSDLTDDDEFEDEITLGDLTGGEGLGDSGDSSGDGPSMDQDETGMSAPEPEPAPKPETGGASSGLASGVSSLAGLDMDNLLDELEDERTVVEDDYLFLLEQVEGSLRPQDLIAELEETINWMKTGELP